MLKKLLIFLVPLLFIASCQKDVPVVLTEPISPPKYDIYVDVLDTTWICQSVLGPYDNLFIDVDEDGINDLYFKALSATFSTDFGTFIGYSYIYYFGINGLGSSYNFALHKDSVSNQLYEEGYLISDSTNWAGDFEFYFFQHEYTSSNSIIKKFRDVFHGNMAFVAIKKIVDQDTYYGWIRLKVNPKISLTIYEIAYNRIPNQPIRIGQTE